MTVEAALAFPLFVFAVTALLYLFVLLQLQAEVGRVLTDTGKELAQEAYLTQGSGEAGNSMAASAYGTVCLNAYLKGRASAEIIKDRTFGLSLAECSWDEAEREWTLRVSYQALLPPGLSWFHPIRVTQERRVRGWIGFTGRQACEGLEDEEIVYVTDYGRVYHRSLSCRHLKLSIRQVEQTETEGLRNGDGAKYYPCERCWKQGSQMVYLTEEGNRYHESLNCSSLSRGIHTRRISETGGLPPCSVCGGG